MLLRKLTVWLPALLWMGVIFSMSAMPGDISGAQSGTVLRVLLAVYGFFFGEAQPDPQTLALLETLVRKGAHMAEYAILAMLYLRALRANGCRRPMAAALLLAIVYAASDEFHQGFVDARGPSAIDVMIDGVGASAGLALCALYSRIKRTEKAVS